MRHGRHQRPGRAGLGTINTSATLGGGLGNISGLITGDANVGKTQIPDLRNIESAIDPLYRNKFDGIIFNFTWDLTDTLNLSYTASHTEAESFQRADYNRVTPSTTFNSTPLSPGGFFDDPQVGLSNQFRTVQFGLGESEQNTHEVRLQSGFDGPFNFSAGASYQKTKARTELYVTGNTLTAVARATNAGIPGCPLDGGPANCVLVDQNPIPTGEGGNYFASITDYQVESYALFGEATYEVSDTFRITAGLRRTEDHKKAQPYAPNLFIPGGAPDLAEQRVTFEEITGRLNLEWTPTLSFTDRSLVYASYARGYKGGGFNPPQTPGQELFPLAYDPEFIDAFEIGVKNTLLGGKMVLNLTGFYYDYKGYQVSQIIQRTAVNTNIDAKVWGAELESIWEPVPNLRLNANIGYLKTELADTSALDLMDLTQGDPNYVTLKNGSNFSNCIAPTAQVAALQTAINLGALPAAAMLGVCNGAIPFVTPLAGIPDQLGGNELPNSPEWTVSLGAQYTWEFAGGWSATPRIDFYWQADSYARIYNRVNDQLEAYTNTNISLTFENADWDVTAQLYVRNVTDETVITDKYLTDDSSGLYTNIFLSEPRTYGVSLTKRF